MANNQVLPPAAPNVPSWRGFVASPSEGSILVKAVQQGLIPPAGKHDHDAPVASGEVFVTVTPGVAAKRFTCQEEWSPTRSSPGLPGGSKMLLALQMCEPKSDRAAQDRPHPPRTRYDWGALGRAILSPIGLDLATVDPGSEGWEWLRAVAGDHTADAKDSVPGGLIKKTIPISQGQTKYTITSFYSLRDAWRHATRDPNGVLAAPSTAFAIQPDPAFAAVYVAGPPAALPAVLPAVLPAALPAVLPAALPAARPPAAIPAPRPPVATPAPRPPAALPAPRPRAALPAAPPPANPFVAPPADNPFVAPPPANPFVALPAAHPPAAHPPAANPLHRCLHRLHPTGHFRGSLRNGEPFWRHTYTATSGFSNSAEREWMRGGKRLLKTAAELADGAENHRPRAQPPDFPDIPMDDMPDVQAQIDRVLWEEGP